MPIEPTGPNAEQIHYWNEVSGPKWVALQEFVDAQIAPLGRAAMDRAELRAGEHILDVGCGCGATSLELAGRVGAAGRVTGIDISAIMLERAKEDARRHGVSHVAFENADAQTHAFPDASYDVVFSRFGVMFFADPVAAFANLRRAARPEGRLSFICWQSLPQNPWMLVPLMAAAQHLVLPPPPPPGAAGPFAFADAARLQGILAAAGWSAIDIDSHEQELAVGGDLELDHVVRILLQMGPTGAVLRDADPEILSIVTASVRTALEPYYVKGQGLRMPGAAWVVRARNSDA